MGQDFFTYLPPEIIIDIITRLPVRTIISCKCVCKPWLDLLATPEFVKSHLSKSVPGLAVFLDANRRPKPYKIFEFADELNPNHRVRHWNMVFDLNLPCNEALYTSANGLLFLCNRSRDVFRFEHDDVVWPRKLFICNPITRDYITLPCPQESFSSKPQLQLYTYGFGVSRMSDQYKLVRIFYGRILETCVFEKLAESECQVYSVGTGLWRRIASGGPFNYECNAVGAFLNGNLHWLVRDLKRSSVWISCFDLETELFSSFSSPACLRGRERWSLSALGDCLCLCSNAYGEETSDDEIVIWLMKQYGDEKSWTKEFVIRKKRLGLSDFVGFVCPIKFFKNGDILMAVECSNKLLYFSSNTQTIREVDVTGLNPIFVIHAIIYTPSFLPLKTFSMENVSSF